MPTGPTKAPSVADRSGSNTDCSSTIPRSTEASMRFTASMPRRKSSMCSGGARSLILYGRAVNGSDTDRDRWRRIASRVLVALASVSILLALVAAYARQATVDSDQFANRATRALQDDSVRSLIAEKITDEVVLKQEADLVAARPIIESVASEIV